MGYIPTTNYGFQKPEKTNAFTVDDLNNALDAIDSKVKEDITTSVESGVDSVTLSSLGMSLDEDGNLSVSVSDKSGRKVSASQNILSAQGNLVFTGELTDATMTVTMVATGKQLYTGNVTSQEIATGAGTIEVKISQYGRTKTYEVQVSGPTPLDISSDIVKITPPTGIISWKYNNNSVSTNSAINVIKYSSSTNVKLVYGQWKDGSDIIGSTTVTPSSNRTISTPEYSEYYEITSSGTFTFPKTATYQIVLIGGGGGGGGGGQAGYSRYRVTQGSSYYYYDAYEGGAGGYGGYHGVIQAYELQFNSDYTENITIGTGGAGGSASSGDTSSKDSNVKGGAGESGGTTIFGTYQAAGGSGGSGGAASQGLASDDNPYGGGDGGTHGSMLASTGNFCGSITISNVSTNLDITVDDGDYKGADGTVTKTGTYPTRITGGSGGPACRSSPVYGSSGKGGSGGTATGNGTTLPTTWGNGSSGASGTNGAVLVRLVL